MKELMWLSGMSAAIIITALLVHKEPSPPMPPCGLTVTPMEVR